METQYSVGSHVRYASHGICRVDNITEMTVPGLSQRKEYYVLRPTGDSSSTVYVPLDNQELLSHMQPIPTREEIEETIRSIRPEELEWIDDRKERAESHKEILRKCERRELIVLAGSLYIRREKMAENGRRLAGTDEATLRRAERLINNELSFVLGIEESQVGGYIHSLLAKQ